MTEQVTKLKSEGRVAAGKRLVEWNRKNKENLVKNREAVASSGDSSNLSSKQEPQSPESGRATFYGGGALAVIVVVGVVALYLYHEKKPIPTTHPLESNDNIFKMN